MVRGFAVNELSQDIRGSSPLHSINNYSFFYHFPGNIQSRLGFPGSFAAIFIYNNK